MHTFNEQEKRDLLQQILIELSKSQEMLEDPKDRAEYFLRLESIYHNVNKSNFRHYYSDFFAWLTLIDSDSSIGNLEILAQNMQTIKSGYIQKNTDKNGKPIDISKEILKLYDHVNLEISRINYTKRMTGETQSELAKTKHFISELEQKLRDSETARTEATKHLNSESDKLKKELHDTQKNMQNEYITILGIFAAIVLAFTGGITFSSSVLQNIHKASTYRILAITLILGIILLNLIWLLIGFLKEIIEKKEDKQKPYGIIFLNALLLLGLTFTFIAYNNHWLDADNNIKLPKTSAESSEPSNTQDSLPSDSSNIKPSTTTR
ncbi:MAG: hypothetical protein HFH39_09955 [Lachnospiraceae bacterium]|nr:hypothetical protein [Lachnospiraceae bacterium]